MGTMVIAMLTGCIIMNLYPCTDPNGDSLDHIVGPTNGRSTTLPYSLNSLKERGEVRRQESSFGCPLQYMNELCRLHGLPHTQVYVLCTCGIAPAIPMCDDSFIITAFISIEAQTVLFQSVLTGPEFKPSFCKYYTCTR